MASIRSSGYYEAYIRKNETWNFVVNTLDLTFYNLALSFIFGSTVLSLYASHLTSSAALIGVIPAIQRAGYFLPQLLMARRAEELSRKKPFVQKISVMERIPYLFVALGILVWPDAPSWISFAILAISLAMAAGSGGLVGPAWKAMLAKVIRVERRGLFFGLSHALGGLLGIAGAAGSRYVLDKYPYPTSFGVCFLLCFASQVLSWVCLSLNREPAREPVKEVLRARAYWRRLPTILRENPNFARYLAARALIVLGTMGTAFYIIYARGRFQVTDAFAGKLTMVALMSQTASTPLLGWLADRRGNKWLTELSTLVGACGLLLILFAPNPLWVYAAFMLLTAASSGMAIAGMSITMEFSDPDELPTFTALASTIVAGPILLSPILGGWLADVAGYQVLFVAALAFTALGWSAMHWGVRDPRYDSADKSPITGSATA